jgi:outer membrane murein-binding lipoprotein Lpp
LDFLEIFVSKEMPEDKLQNQEQQQKLNAKIDALAEEVDQLRKANTTLVDRLKEAEQKAEMAENEVKIK